MAKYVEHQVTDKSLLVTWALTDKDAAGEAYTMPPYRSASVQAGIFTGLVEWSGSLLEDEPCWTLLEDQRGGLAMIGPCELKQLAQDVHRVKPEFRGEGAVEAYLLIRRL